MQQKTIRVLPREIMIATKWAFRAAKLPAGYSVAVIEMIRHAEIYHGIGISTLHHYLTAGKQIPPKRAIFVTETAQASIIDAQGESALICGPSAHDLAEAAAKRQGVYTVYVKNVGGGFMLLEQLADQAARRGLVCLLTFNVSSSKDEPPSWCSLIALPKSTGPLLVNIFQQQLTGAAATLAKPIEEIAIENIFSPSYSASREQLSTLLLDIALNSGISISIDSFLIRCFSPNTDEQISDLATNLQTHLAQRLDKAGRIGEVTWQTSEERAVVNASANRHGLAVDKSLWSRIKQYGTGIFVPVPNRARPTGAWSKRNDVT